MYNFKRTLKLYIVRSGIRHSIEIYPDIAFSQTYSEEAYGVRTLHNLGHLHEAATITRARPANFSFTYPLRDQTTKPILLSLGGDFTDGTCVTFDIYFELDGVTYKITNATISSLVFNIERTSLLTISVEGQGSRLSTHTGAVPGTPASIDPDEYVKIDRLNIDLDATTLTSITSMNIELVNGVEWNENATLQDTLAGTMIYPTYCYSTSRRISGSVTQYITDDNETEIPDSYQTNASLDIDIYGGGQLITPILGFSLPSVVFTARENLNELLTKTYDFRLVDNSANASGNKPLYKGV
jgi:hypothetical protein